LIHKDNKYCSFKILRKIELFTEGREIWPLTVVEENKFQAPVIESIESSEENI
jgi:hypothetical protein